jgi:hypothetical protein
LIQSTQIETPAHHCESSLEEEQEVKQVESEESVDLEHQVALWHDPHTSSEQHDGPTAYCPLDDYKSRSGLPPVLAKWIDKEASEPVLDEAHALSEELQMHFDNYLVVKKKV